MTSNLLLQTVFVPIIAAVLILLLRTKKGFHAGWITIVSLIYTSILLFIAGMNIYQGGSVFEGYAIGPNVGLNLLADGLSLPIALIINIICVVLAFIPFTM